MADTYNDGYQAALTDVALAADRVGTWGAFEWMRNNSTDSFTREVAERHLFGSRAHETD